jgi:hypothetical protein
MRLVFHITAEHMRKEKKLDGKMDFVRSIVLSNTVFLSN